MPLFYFDIREDEILIADDEGVDLSGIGKAQQAAAQLLAEIATEMADSSTASPLALAIEVRNESGPVLQARFTFNVAAPEHWAPHTPIS